MQGLTWTSCARAPGVQSHCMMAIAHIDDAVAATVAALTAEPGGNNVERIDIMSQPVNDDAIDYFAIDQHITLRRMVLRNSNPKGTILFLHGFPETLYVWKDIARALADDYEVHAFDWPGYGLSSRPTVDRFSYAPKDYARILDRYFGKAGIDTSKLTIYATDIGALPTLSCWPWKDPI
jgi:pimeloyl-ACP methyl ester carboxylesterase